MPKCGYITHSKGSLKIKAHTTLDAAVQHAKQQTKVTVVMRMCPGNPRTPVIARCKDGGCGSSLSGVRKRRKKSKKKRR